jgi:hypothetical protein
MAKTMCLLGLLGLLAAAPAGGPCDLKTTEPTDYCEKCERAVTKFAVEGGKCTTCKTEVKKAELCVKKHYVCGCGANATCCEVDKFTPGNCKCAKPLKETDDKCLVLYVCEGCGAKNALKDAIKHDEAKDKDAKKKGIKKTCEKSGSPPHGTK